MTRFQSISIIFFLTLFALLYWGFDTKAPSQRTAEASTKMSMEAKSPQSFVEEAVSRLDGIGRAEYQNQTSVIEQTESGPEQSALLKKLSSWWYARGEYIAAGLAAREVAELDGTDEAWSVCGATFYNALSASREPVDRVFCADQAVAAFESATSLAPEIVEHRVNAALVFAEQPPADNPMKAVLLLRELEGKYPENASVYNALGRLAIKTGQWERARERLETAWKLDPQNPNTPCLLAKVYSETGDQTKAKSFADLCSKRN